MEHAVLFFFCGLALYAARRLVLRRNTAEKFLLLLMPLTGAVFGLLLLRYTGSPWSGLTAIPGVFVVIFCVLGALLLALAETLGIIRKPGIQYFATLVVSVAVTLLFYLALAVYFLASGVTLPGPGTRNALLLLLLLHSFLMAFGYTFPARLFVKRETGA